MAVVVAMLIAAPATRPLTIGFSTLEAVVRFSKAHLAGTKILVSALMA